MKSLELTELSKIYRTRKHTVEAVKNLTLSLESGEIFGFLGPNGAGKSTTIKAIMGLISPSAGTVRIMGESSTKVDARRKVGYLPENPSFYDFLTAWEYVLFVGRMFGIPKPVLMESAEAVLKLVDLWDVRKRTIRSYSKGMVQRLGLAQLLVHNPDVLIMDEPMSGLDPLGRALVKEIILDLKNKGKTIFFSTHITSDVESVCDRVGIILKGKLQCVEQVAVIMRNGIDGYRLTVAAPSAADLSYCYVPKDKLPEEIMSIQTAGKEITLIEPVRKNLETFFLDMVRGKGL